MAKSKDASIDDIASLRRELEAERTARISAEGRVTQESSARRKAEQANMSAQERALVSDQEACDSSIQALESELQAMEDQIAKLSDEPGNGKEIAALTRKIGTGSAKLEREAARKDWLAGQREKFTKERDAAGKVRETPATADNPIGVDVSTFGPRTQGWLRRHPEVLKDPALWKRTVAAANVALAAGTEDESDAYFETIERTIGMRDDDDQDDQGDQGEEIAAEDRRRGQADNRQTQDDRDDRTSRERYEAEKPQTRAAGPGSMADLRTQRRIPSGGGGGGNRRLPNLSADEKDAALDLYSREPGLSDADKMRRYAENKAFMQGRTPGHFGGRA